MMLIERRMGTEEYSEANFAVLIDALRFPSGSLRLFAGILDFGLASHLRFAPVVSLRSALLSNLLLIVENSRFRRIECTSSSNAPLPPHLSF
jgi:hypothetical protein